MVRAHNGGCEWTTGHLQLQVQFKPLWEICYVIMISHDCMFYTDAFTGIECGMSECAVCDQALSLRHACHVIITQGRDSVDICDFLAM